VEDEPSDELPHGVRSHPRENQVFVVSGKGVIVTEQVQVEPGDCEFIPAREPHTIGPRAGHHRSMEGGLQ
jgi:mannose-6-phosphate isomerase-like protein (cupin superfamily)